MRRRAMEAEALRAASKSRARALELGLTLLVGALYALFLTGDYFVAWSPLHGRSLMAVVVLLIVALAIARFALGFPLALVLRQQAHLVALGIILAAGLLVRLYPLSLGLPGSLPGDEPAVMEAAWRILRTGDFNLHSFTLSNPYVYLQAGTFALRFLEGVSSGLYSKLEMTKVADFYSWARFITAVFGVATLYLVYLAGTRLYSRTVGLLGLFLLSFSFLHAQFSRTVSPDVPAAFLITMALLCLSVIASSREISRFNRTALFVAAGATIGLATATRLSMVVGIFPLILTYYLIDAPKGRRRWDLKLGLTAILGGFLTGAPFALLDLPSFVNGLGALTQTHGFKGFLGLPPSAPWREVTSYFLGLDFGVLLAGLVGAGVAAARRQRGDLLILSFAAPFFALVASCNGDFAHTLVPLMPFGAILAARAVDWLVGEESGLSARLTGSLDRIGATTPWITAVMLVGVSLLH